MTTETKVRTSYLSLTKPDLVRATIRGLKTETRRVLTKANSTIGEGGDWGKLDFEGKTIHREDCLPYDLRWLQIDRPALLAFRDEGFPDPKTGEKNYQYLHVPYNWAEDMTIYRVYPKWEVGQLLGIKESWGVSDFSKKFPGKLQIVYRAGVSDIDHPNGGDEDRLWRDVDDATWQKYAFKNQWRGPRFMPAWAIRIWVQLESVRPERVQEITEEGAKAEGLEAIYKTAPNTYGAGYIWDAEGYRRAFHTLWDTINAKRGYGWDTNCWIWCLKYRLLSATGLQVAEVALSRRELLKLSPEKRRPILEGQAKALVER